MLQLQCLKLVCLIVVKERLSWLTFSGQLITCSLLNTYLQLRTVAKWVLRTKLLKRVRSPSGKLWSHVVSGWVKPIEKNCSPTFFFLLFCVNVAAEHIYISKESWQICWKKLIALEYFQNGHMLCKREQKLQYWYQNGVVVNGLNTAEEQNTEFLPVRSDWHHKPSKSPPVQKY